MKRNLGPSHQVWCLLSVGLCGVVACGGGGVYGTYVETAPPPERVEVVEVAPGPGYLWVDGHWNWTGRAYAWEPGRWVVAEGSHHTWARGHWKHNRRGWHWVDGHWR